MFNCFLQNTVSDLYLAFCVIFVFGKLVMFFLISRDSISNSKTKVHRSTRKQRVKKRQRKALLGEIVWIAKVVGSGALVYPTSSIQDSINVEG